MRKEIGTMKQFKSCSYKEQGGITQLGHFVGTAPLGLREWDNNYGGSGLG
jgi:hypothetical protein|tara:strand:- start:204 stop:353 length:150 start_codon:yes stop_codon:yes gene_type:complete